MARSGIGRLFSRGKIARDYDAIQKWGQPQVNNRGEICVAQALPQSTEQVRLGQSWLATPNGQTVTFLGIPDATHPAQAAGILNNFATSAFVIDTISFRIALASTETINSITGYYAIVPFGYSGLLLQNADPFSLSGRGLLHHGSTQGSTTNVNVTYVAAQYTGPAISWIPLGSSLQDLPTNLQVTASIEYPLRGRIIVQPNTALIVFMAVNSILSTATYGPVIMFHSAPLIQG